VSRRNFIKGAGVLSASLTTALLVPGRASAQQKTLKLLQWNHFVPGYDKWFNETYVKAWGEKNNTNVMVDNISLAGLNSRAAAEVSAQKGHDLFMFLWPPPVHEDQVIDHREIYQECDVSTASRRPGDQGTYNPRRRSNMVSRIVMS
jgi:multiple sugar transport system substrate-binding protein